MGCNEKKPKKELIRIVKNKEGIISLDKTGKQEGRGEYICNSVECLEKDVKSKRLEKVLEKEISEQIYNNLKDVIINDKQFNKYCKNIKWG